MNARNPDWPTWLMVGATGFGGPAGQIAILHREIVERRQWLGEEEFLAALKVCMLLPGPEAQQLATYAGWRRGGIAGGPTVYDHHAPLARRCLCRGAVGPR